MYLCLDVRRDPITWHPGRLRTRTRRVPAVKPLKLGALFVGRFLCMGSTLGGLLPILIARALSFYRPVVAGN
jgi:hypothetical protein